MRWLADGPRRPPSVANASCLVQTVQLTPDLANNRTARAASNAAQVHQGRVVASMACEPQTRAWEAHPERTATNRGVDPASEDACRRTSSRAAGGERTLREDGLRHVSCSGSTPARGGIGRSDLLRKFRTATRPIAFAAAHACGGNDRRGLEDVGCERGAMCPRSETPFRTDEPGPRSCTRTPVGSKVSNPRMG